MGGDELPPRSGPGAERLPASRKPLRLGAEPGAEPTGPACDDAHDFRWVRARRGCHGQNSRGPRTAPGSASSPRARKQTDLNQWRREHEAHHGLPVFVMGQDPCSPPLLPFLISPRRQDLYGLDLSLVILPSSPFACLVRDPGLTRGTTSAAARRLSEL